MRIDSGIEGDFDRARFVQVFGAVYEHSPWLAENVYDGLGDTAVVGKEGLIERFAQAFLSSSKAQQLNVLRAHPELACQRAGSSRLTAASEQEQSGSGLDQCSEHEFKLFQEMNNKYQNKNNFPFIVAVKGLNRSDILEHFKQRLANHGDVEFEAALQQVNRIAKLRIQAILND